MRFFPFQSHRVHLPFYILSIPEVAAIGDPHDPPLTLIKAASVSETMFWGHKEGSPAFLWGGVLPGEEGSSFSSGIRETQAL